jgi:hypothetical protein
VTVPESVTQDGIYAQVKPGVAATHDAVLARARPGTLAYRRPDVDPKQGCALA